LLTFAEGVVQAGVVENGAMAALVIIATSIAPVILLSGALIRDREA